MKKISIILLIIITALVFSSATCRGASTADLYLSPKAFQEPQPFNDVTAAELISGMTIGWNLGNTLDASGGGGSVSIMESAWAGHVTTQENIDTVKNAGFNTIRIPVTWYKTLLDGYKIRDDWMDRVTEIVNYAVNNDMYIIINTHHDESIFKFTQAQKEESLKAFTTIWAQIAHNFKNYNEKLIFEPLNEPRTKGSPNEWSGGTPPEYRVLNEYYQVFTDLIRKTGGNNNKRILLFNTYAASAEMSAIMGLVLPKDTAENKIAASMHSYSPYNFALNQGSGAVSTWSKLNIRDTSPIDDLFNKAEAYFLNRGIPVIIGEFGSVDRKNDQARIEWAEYYVSKGREFGIPCILWDNHGFTGAGELFGLFDRRTNTFPNQAYLDALLRGAGVK